MIDMVRSLFIVDGATEIAAFTGKARRTYNCSPQFRKVTCNGKNVSPAGYANAASGILIKALFDRYLHIVCVLDLEARHMQPANFAKAVKKTIIDQLKVVTKFKEEELCTKIIVCVANRMFENWIVADVEGLKVRSELVKSDALQKQYDGSPGTSILKQIMKVPYKKTQHGPVLFTLVSCRCAKNNSLSFATFVASLGLDSPETNCGIHLSNRDSRPNTQSI
jgi:hypothetical protein